MVDQTVKCLIIEIVFNNLQPVIFKYMILPLSTLRHYFCDKFSNRASIQSDSTIYFYKRNSVFGVSEKLIHNT